MLELKDDRYSTSVGEDSLTISDTSCEKECQKKPFKDNNYSSKLYTSGITVLVFSDCPRGPSRIWFCAVSLIRLPAGAEARSWFTQHDWSLFKYWYQE